MAKNNGTVTGTVTFNDNSENTGAVHGSATFTGRSKNSGTVDGGVTRFNGSSRNKGAVTGDAVFNDMGANKTGGTVSGFSVISGCGAPEDLDIANYSYTVDIRTCPDFIHSEPPLLGSWYTGGTTRKISIIGSDGTNPEQLQAIGHNGNSFMGPWADCPSNGCFKNPAIYRPHARFDYILNYADNLAKNYEVEPL